MQIGIPMKGLIFFLFPPEIKKKTEQVRNDDAMKTYSWYSKQLTQTAS